MKKMHSLLAAAVAVSCMIAAAPVFAQSYPERPVTLIVPWPAGGGVDTMGRVAAEILRKGLGQSVVVENKGGAGGNIGTALAAHAHPDGYTLLMASTTPNAVNEHLYSKPGYNAQADFAPIALVGATPNILVVPTNSPFKSVDELIAFAKANPGKLTYGSGGIGSTQHLAGVRFMQAAKIDMLHVPYKGTAPAEADLMAGHVSVMLDTAPSIPLIASGRLRALAVAAPQRTPVLPNVATLDELGVPDVHITTWYGVMAPTGTPVEIIERLNKEITQALGTPELRKKMAEMGADTVPGSPQDFGHFVTKESERYKEIVQASGAKLD